MLLCPQFFVVTKKQTPYMVQTHTDGDRLEMARFSDRFTSRSSRFRSRRALPEAQLFFIQRQVALEAGSIKTTLTQNSAQLQFATHFTVSYYCLTHYIIRTAHDCVVILQIANNKSFKFFKEQIWWSFKSKTVMRIVSSWKLLALQPMTILSGK